MEWKTPSPSTELHWPSAQDATATDRMEKKGEEQDSKEEEPCSEMDPEETHHNTDTLYALDKIVRLVGSCPF